MDHLLYAGLPHKRFSLLSQTRNDTVISFLVWGGGWWEGFRTVHVLRSISEDLVNARSHPDSRPASESQSASCLPTQHAVTQIKSSYDHRCLTSLDLTDLTTDNH